MDEHRDFSVSSMAINSLTQHEYVVSNLSVSIPSATSITPTTSNSDTSSSVTYIYDSVNSWETNIVEQTQEESFTDLTSNGTLDVTLSLT